MVKRMMWVTLRGEEVAAATPQQLLAFRLRPHGVAMIKGVECLLTAADPPSFDETVGPAADLTPL